MSYSAEHRNLTKQKIVRSAAETGAAQRLLAPVSSSREGGDSGYSNLPVTKWAGHSFQSDCPGH
jgi:hypothetical protein